MRGFFCPCLGDLGGGLHVVVLGRVRLSLILCAGTPVIYLLVSGAGLKASAGFEASRPVGNVVT